MRGNELRGRGGPALAAWLMVQCAFGQAPAADPTGKPMDGRVTVALKVVAAKGRSINCGVDFDGVPAGKAVLLTSTGVVRTGTAVYDVAVRTEGLGGAPPRCRVWIDSDADGDLDKEKPLDLARGESATVDVKRKRAGGAARSYRVELSGDERSETITWMPQYRAEGLARVDGKDCRVLLQDLTFDGAFDLGDVERGNALGVDLNGDGEIRGAMEQFSLSEVVSLGQRRFTIEGLTTERLVLEPAAIEIPILGAPVPQMDLRSIDGNVIALRGERERPLVAEFWASWCVPCVQMMPRVKELALERGIDVVYISIDQKGAGAEKARAIAEKHGIAADHLVMRGLGGRDEAFRAFASTPIERERTWSDGSKEIVKGRVGVGVPLLVVIDRQGVMRYAGNGGQDLTELKQAVEQALKKPGE